MLLRERDAAELRRYDEQSEEQEWLQLLIVLLDCVCELEHNLRSLAKELGVYGSHFVPLFLAFLRVRRYHFEV